MDPLIKRKTGGQPHNQNARKHGFYSKVLSKEEQRQLKLVDSLEGIDEEMKILRIKFRSVLAQDGHNLPLIIHIVKTLGRLSYFKSAQKEDNSAQFQEAVAAVLEEFTIPAYPKPDSDPSIRPPSISPVQDQSQF